MVLIQFVIENGGMVLALLGAALAIALPGIGSARGVSLVGESASALVMEQQDKFGQTLVLQLLPGTQGLYGFVVGLVVLGKISPELPTEAGLAVMMAALPIAFVGLFSAISQAKVAVRAVTLFGNNPEDFVKGIIYSVMVETYAILAFVGSLILLNSI